jgi:GTP-binding protein EngB required for normal cell division
MAAAPRAAIMAAAALAPHAACAAPRHAPCAPLRRCAWAGHAAPRAALPPARRRRPCCSGARRCVVPPLAAVGDGGGSGLFSPSGADGRGSFAAPKRASVTLPALLVTLSADEVDARATALEAAVAAGATAVLVSEAEGGAGQLYDAVCAVRAALRDRAALLVGERADIAAAAEADGVVLSRGALPTVVARRTLEGARLVLRACATPEEAATAAREGADALLMEAGADVAAAARGVSIPVLAAPVVGSASGDAWGAPALARAGASGLALPLSALPPASTPADVAAVLDALRGSGKAAGAGAAGAPAAPVDDASLPPAPPLLSAAGAALVASERALLDSMLTFLAEATPAISEASLLREARDALDDPFLLVVAGEFNSGKSSVINALLGRRFLKEGILPTTNEISVLRAGADGAPQRTAAAADGHFDLYLPCSLLRQLNIVDTPGTNVILERQQRLTEEFVPRADLVLFVLSADRPLTESEARFLTYIRQWDKRVVFALNKVDMLASEDEVAQVRTFVADNASRLLGTPAGDGEVFPVSARAAQRAKDALPQPKGGAAAAAEPPAWGRPPPALARAPDWRASGFGELEAFIARFLGGDADAGVPGEALRLKLATPLSLGAALLEAASRALAAQADAAAAERAAAGAVRRQMDAFRGAMEKDALIQRARVRELVRAAAGRGERFVDAQLRLQNAQRLLLASRPAAAATSSAAAGGDADAASAGALAAAVAAEGADSIAAAYVSQVVSTGMDELREALAEHTQWLRRNASRQREHYAAVVAQRGFADGAAAVAAPSRRDAAAPSAAPPVVRPLGEAPEPGVPPAPPSAASVVAARFDQGAAALLLAEEVRQAAVATAGSAGAALALGVLLTAALPTFGEDALSLALAGTGAYVGVLNLPLRRAEVKAKLVRAADAFAAELEAAMEAELAQALATAVGDVTALVAPWEAAAQAEAAAVAAAQARREAEDAKLRALQAKVQLL